MRLEICFQGYRLGLMPPGVKSARIVRTEFDSVNKVLVCYAEVVEWGEPEHGTDVQVEPKHT